MSTKPKPIATAKHPEPGVPLIPFINWRGLQTLYMKEVKRFFKVQLQTVWAPAITTLLFLAIFTVALGRGDRQVLGFDFNDFLAPGLIIMAMIQNAFQNSQSSLLIGKIQGTIVDILMPPLSTWELLVSFVAGAVTRGLLVGAAVYLAMWLWPGVSPVIREPWAIVFFGLSGMIMLALLGILVGLWADKFDHAAAVTNFLVQPLSLLSGTFYVIERLPELARTISLGNPFFYVIDGFRYGFLGVADGPIGQGMIVLTGINLALLAACYRVLSTGWRIKN
ncbi:ABC transporter permease [Pacificimonas sp. WHA3]|uniref:Transport permease protein n=1 Tax=Pacificimonas pallii TaxID=2827236 RepID=A0ABS6SHG5_9SPHN|nr:ABC transporter permease [Pacificimonas pallii]MBV7257863.1 ABC transporter permease [Pacificimonas pallii]